MKALLCNKTHFFSHKKIENRKELDYDIVDGECENDAWGILREWQMFLL